MAQTRNRDKTTAKTAAPARRRAVRAAIPVDEEGLPRAITELPDDRNFVAALARGLAVLNAFSDRKRNMSIADVSRRTELPRATVRRSLYTLEKLGYVSEDDARRFYLRPRVLVLGHAYLSATPLALLAQPVLDRLSEQIRESCSLAVLERDEIIYVARSTSSRIMSPALNVGRRLPAYCTSIGRIILAHAAPEEIDSYLSRNQFQAFTPHTLTSREALRQALKAARHDGYATADQQLEPHFRTLAVAVRDTYGRAVAGINVIIPDERLSLEQMVERFAGPLQAAARELGSCLLP